ncbi:MAG: hypothetical protein WC856_26500 [Methylococcaceae bacterium]|jgi:hypothetical protein
MNSVSEILDRQREELVFVRKLIDEALQQRSTELIKFAKLFAEVVSVVQECECRAYGIDNASIDLIRLAKDEKAKRMLDKQ